MSGVGWAECLGGWALLDYQSSAREYCYLATPAPYQEQRTICKELGGSLAELGTDLDTNTFLSWVRYTLGQARSRQFNMGGEYNTSWITDLSLHCSAWKEKLISRILPSCLS